MARRARLEVRHSEFVVIRETRQATEVVIRMDKPVNHQVSVLRASLAGDNVPPAGAIRGRVVDPRGRRVRNFTVTLLPVTDNEPRDSGSYGNPSRQFSDHDGQFVIGRLGADKRYRVSVSATGFGRAVVEPIYARLETTIKDRDIIEFRLLPPHVARIHVIDAETKVPIPDIMVGVIDNSRLRQLFEWNLTMVGARTEWTSADGTDTFENLASEIVPVFVESPGYARTHAVWKKLPGESIESGLDRIEIALQKEAQLQIRLANPGFRDVRTLHAGLTSPAKEEFQSDSADVGRPAKIRFRQLPPGKYSLSIFDAAIKEPWTPLTTQDVELKPGDNDVTIDLTANR